MLPSLYAAGCATSFPHALMMAASFNRSLWAAVGETIGVVEFLGVVLSGRVVSCAGSVLREQMLNTLAN